MAHKVVDGICQHLDMPSNMCADCRGHRSVEEQIADEKKPSAASRFDGPPFKARYASRCTHCGDLFEEGELIYWCAEEQDYVLEEHRE